MDRRAKLVALALALCAGAAQAGYAQLAPPSGFSGAYPEFKFAPSANQQTFGKVIYQNGALRAPIAGSSVTMPAAYRLAANAPRVAASLLYMNPYIRVAAGIATWLSVSQVFWNEATKQWEKPDVMEIPPYNWPTPTYHGDGWTNVKTCRNGYWGYEYYNSQYAWANPYWQPLQAGCVPVLKSKPLTKEEFEHELNPHITSPGTPWTMPQSVPLELPGPSPLPVEQPVINPEPGSNPQPRPLFVPTGNPVPNPNYDPNAAPGPNNQPWLQPGVRIVPSPTLNDPWRVDLQPVDRPVPGPEPMPDPDSETPTNPDSPKSPDQVGLCDMYPDILACQKLGTTQAAELPKNTVDMSIAPEGGFGPSTGACPAPKTFQIMGKPMAFRWDLLCDFASQIRPLLIGFAWLSAGLAFLGLSRRD